MNRTVLDKCLKTFLDAYRDEQATYDLLFGRESNFLSTILEEFQEELRFNILFKVSHQEKIDIVKLYISEIERAKSYGAMNVVIDIDLLSNDDENHSYAEATRLTRQVDGLLSYFFKKLLDMIQSQCKIYNLPFFRIHNEMRFFLAGLNYDLIAGHEESKTQKSKPTSIASQTLKKMNVEGEKEFNEILMRIRNSENLFWKDIPMEMVIEHFKVFLKSENRFEIPFLTEDQFVSFLKRSFLKFKTEPRQRMYCPYGKKGLIIKRFYELYSIQVGKGYDQEKDTYIDLIMDCFENWDRQTVEFLFKPGKTKVEWN